MIGGNRPKSSAYDATMPPYRNGPQGRELKSAVTSRAGKTN